MVERIIRSLSLLSLAVLIGIAWWEHERAESLATELANFAPKAKSTAAASIAQGAQASAAGEVNYSRQTGGLKAAGVAGKNQMEKITHEKPAGDGSCRVHPDLWRMLQARIDPYLGQAATGPSGGTPPACESLADWAGQTVEDLETNAAGLAVLLEYNAKMDALEAQNGAQDNPKP